MQLLLPALHLQPSAGGARTATHFCKATGRAIPACAGRVLCSPPERPPGPSGTARALWPQHHHLWTCDIHMCLKKSSGCPAPLAPLLSVPAGATCCVIWASPTARIPQHPVQTNRGAAGPTGCLEPLCPLTCPSAPHCVFTSFHCLHLKWAWENGVTVLTRNC